MSKETDELLKICPHCKKEYKDYQMHLAMIDVDLSLGELGLCPQCFAKWNNEIEEYL